MSNEENTFPYVIAYTAPGGRRCLKVFTRFAEWISFCRTEEVWNHIDLHSIIWKNIYNWFLHEKALKFLIEEANKTIDPPHQFEYPNPVNIPASTYDHDELARLAAHFGAFFSTDIAANDVGYKSKIYEIFCHVKPLDYACQCQSNPSSILKVSLEAQLEIE